MITASLTGLDTVPPNDGARALSIAMAVCGLTIIAYAGAVIVEAISGGVVSGALAERRRHKKIDQLRDHYIICGYGRVGRRVAEEFRAAGTRYVVLDWSEQAIEAAHERGDLMINGNATHDEELQKAGIDRARGTRRRVGRRRRQPVHHAVGAQPAARPADRGARIRRGGEEEARARGRRPRRHAVHRRGADDGDLSLKPQVAAFIDTVTTAAGPDLHLAEIEVGETCASAGKSIRDLRVRH